MFSANFYDLGRGGKRPPQSPQPQPTPRDLLYIREGLPRLLWNQLFECFHLISSYTHARVKEVHIKRVLSKVNRSNAVGKTCAQRHKFEGELTMMEYTKLCASG